MEISTDKIFPSHFEMILFYRNIWFSFEKEMLICLKTINEFNVFYFIKRDYKPKATFIQRLTY